MGTKPAGAEVGKSLNREPSSRQVSARKAMLPRERPNAGRMGLSALCNRDIFLDAMWVASLQPASAWPPVLRSGRAAKLHFSNPDEWARARRLDADNLDPDLACTLLDASNCARS